MKIMIIGGTSGIGLAMAAHYAGQGAQLALCGRDIGRLGAHPLGAYRRVRTYQFDIADYVAVHGAIRDFGQGGLDILIVTAGQYADIATLASDPGLGPAMVRTNVVGLAQAFDAAAMLMQRQGYGQLVAVASIAGLLKKYPGGSLYSASKRAALHMCDAYRMAVEPFGIAVTAIVPGYVDTARLRDLNGGDASAKPFLQPEAVAIKRIAAAIEQRAECLIFPWQLHLMARLFNCLPSWLRQLRRK